MKTPLKQLNTVVWKEGRYYVAQCLNIDVSSFGKTKREAMKNIDDALNLYFEDSSPRTIRSVKNPELISLRLAHA